MWTGEFTLEPLAGDVIVTVPAIAVEARGRRQSNTRPLLRLQSALFANSVVLKKDLARTTTVVETANMTIPMKALS